MSAPGSIILLHGPSSVGKSTLAGALQAGLALPFWHISIDHLRDAGVLPRSRIASGEFRWADLREPFFEGFHRMVPALASAGNNLIVEHIVETEAWLDRLVHLLGGFDVFTVTLEVPLDELERRERERGDRPIGDARRDFETLDVPLECDLTLDATRSPGANAAEVIAAWDARTPPSAFGRMQARLRP